MPENRPLLLFNKPNISSVQKILRPISQGFIKPNRGEQWERLNKKMNSMNEAFIANTPSEISAIEKVLVLEVLGEKITDLSAAAKKIGLECLDQVIEDFEIEENIGFKTDTIKVNLFKTENITKKTDELKEIYACLKNNDFILENQENKKYFWNEKKSPGDFSQFIPEKLKHAEIEIIKILKQAIKKEGCPTSLRGKLFLCMSNQDGIEQLLRLWRKYKNNGVFERGTTPWRDVFDCLHNIRYWNENDRLEESNILQNLRNDAKIQTENISFELEFWYKENEEKRKIAERNIREIVQERGGNVGEVKFYQKHDVKIHLAKVNLPPNEVQLALNGQFNKLFKNDNIKFFRPSGQNSLNINSQGGFSSARDFNRVEKNNKPPIIAMLDGLPLQNHEALSEKLTIDDPDDFQSSYPSTSRLHGTSMASLICNGDLEIEEKPLERKIYVRPILKNHPIMNVEEIPSDLFFEDIIERSVRRMFEETGDIPPMASNVKIINLSVGHKSRWFYKNMTSGGRLLDYLSWKYKVLFLVSAGNFLDNIQIENNNSTNEDLTKSIIKKIMGDHRLRKIIMPADSINSITVGATHTDNVSEFNIGNRIDILPSGKGTLSPISSIGYGFKNSIKPDVLLPGGRQLYNNVRDSSPSQKEYEINKSNKPPGQKVAIPSNKYSYTRGTSNANALASRSAGLIFEMLEKNKFNIPNGNYAVVLKTLLVHSAKWGEAKESFPKASKKDLPRYLGFGIPNILG